MRGHRLYNEGSQVIIFKQKCISFSKNDFVLANSHGSHRIFIWVFTVCESTRCRGVHTTKGSRYQDDLLYTLGPRNANVW